MPNVRLVSPLLSLLFALTVHGAVAPREQPEVSNPIEIEAQSADLKDLQSRPIHFRGELVKFTLQLGTPEVSWNPYLTRFDERRYQSWSAWADSQALWHYADFSAPVPRIFALRESAAAHALSEGSRYGRFEVTAIVRTVFLGDPWIELLSATPLAASHGEGTLLHASRAIQFVADDLFSAAVSQYERALDAPMPKQMEARMRSEQKDALAKAAKPVDAE
jgi:hypothetical protein